MLSLPFVCRLFVLCLVPIFNCPWYLYPFPFSFTKRYGATRCHSTISTVPIYQTFLPFFIQSLQLHNSSFPDIDNLIWPQPMSFELPWMLHELVVVDQYQISLLTGFIIDVSIMVGLLSFLLYLLMESCDKPIFLQFDQLREPLLNNSSVIHICKGCNS
jgi:hypothetical protein